MHENLLQFSENCGRMKKSNEMFDAFSIFGRDGWRNPCNDPSTRARELSGLLQ